MQVCPECNGSGAKLCLSYTVNPAKVTVKADNNDTISASQQSVQNQVACTGCRGLGYRNDFGV